MVGRLYRLPVQEAKARAADVLERFELTEAADRRVSTYSGGMRRRLDLGASLTGRPPVMLLDEPTTGLDPRTRQELWNTVDQLRRDGTTVLLTTQYLEEADRLAQRIAVVDHGRIAAEGTAAGAQGDRRQRGARRARRRPDAHSADAAAALADLTARADRRRRGGRDPPRGRRPERLRRGGAPARLRGLPIAAIELQQPSLDDVFLTLTGRCRDREGRMSAIIRRTDAGSRFSEVARRQPRDGRPPAAQDPAQAGLRDLRVRAAGDVRAAVPLRLRRRDRHRRRRLRRLPDARASSSRRRSSAR